MEQFFSLVQFLRHCAASLVGLAAAAALLSSCTCVPQTYVATSMTVSAGVAYPDMCLRSPHGAVDFDAQLWLPRASDPAHFEVVSCVSPSLKATVAGATLTLLTPTQVEWTHEGMKVLLSSEGASEPQHCG